MSHSYALRRLFGTPLLLLLLSPVAAMAQETGGSSEIPARLRHLEGTVTVQRAAAGETEEGVINLPLGSGDRVWSGDNGRVELMLEDGTTLWMDASTTLDFVSLPRPAAIDGTILRLWTGAVFVQRPYPDSGVLAPLRLDTPSGAVSFDSGGLFRVDLDQDQTAWLSTYDGSALLDAGGIAERVTAGNRALVQSGSAPSRAVAFNTSETDDFSDWREARYAVYASTHQYAAEREYVPKTIVHYAADLEPYGSWGYHPTLASWYWKPYAAVSWTPYRDGRWVYTYGGWSWVPGTSWGYVTTHYGRWHYGSGGWIWFPGRVWTPASVHWYVGSGYVGWVPLNYYNQPAVSFGVHVGGGVVGINVGINLGGYYDYPYYGYPYYGYPSYGYPYYRNKRYDRYGGHYAGDYRRPLHYPSYRGEAVAVGPIGSASRKARVVNGRGYSSGLADAWTMVPGDSFSSRDVGRAAVSRAALPRDLNEQSKALVSGALRARQPGSLVPGDVRAARTAEGTAQRRAVPANSAPGAVRATGNGGSVTPGAVRNATPPSSDARRAVPSTARSRPTAQSPARSIQGPARSTQAGARSVQAPARSTQAGARSIQGPARSTQGQAPPATGVRRRGDTPTERSASAPRSNLPGRAVQRTAPAPRGSGPTVSGAARQTTGRSASPTVRTPQARTRSGGAPAAQGAPAARPQTSASRPRSARPSNAIRPAGAVRPSASSRPSGVARPSASSRPSGVARPSASSRPSGVARPSASSRPSGVARPSASSRPSGAVRPSAIARPSGAGRPSATARPSGAVRATGSSRPSGAVRPAPSAGRAPSARPAPAPSRSGSKAAPRPAKPRGGASK